MGRKVITEKESFPVMIPVKCRILSFGKIISVFYFRQNEIYDEMYMEILQEYKAEDDGFYLENGVCYLYFQQGEITYNAAGSFRIKLAEYQ